MCRPALLTTTALLLTLLALCPPAQAQTVRRFAADRSGAGEYAVRLARRALESYCLRREKPAVPAALPPLLQRRCGVFVSTMCGGAPRCCMGSLYPRGPHLAADLIETAALAAGHDLRFAPLQPAELSGLRVIVSIVDPPEPIRDPARLDPLTDGLAVRGALRTGVVLPGETTSRARFVEWGRVRAGAAPGERVQYLRLNAIRFLEPSRPQPRQAAQQPRDCGIRVPQGVLR